MFDLGWSEMLVLVVVAIVVIGPKDLPRALRTVGQWVGRAKAVAREFQNSVDEMVREADLEDLRKQADSFAKLDFEEGNRRTKPVDPTGSTDGPFDPASNPPHDIAPLDPGEAGAPGNVTSLPRSYTPPAEGGEEPDAADRPDADGKPGETQAAKAAGAGEPKATR